ncbi:hypothetical protein, partial [uncultured Ruminococcus sp.]|uniref:hypothetical protein n=1 Tax=uncultured Ruminococcus sp. TaxID=165186 RepID=UPI0025D33665
AFCFWGSRSGGGKTVGRLGERGCQAVGFGGVGELIKSAERAVLFGGEKSAGRLGSRLNVKAVCCLMMKLKMPMR